MDGFFVAKFKVTKRAKEAKEDSEKNKEILMEEDVALEDVQFDEREDEEYIRGKSTRVDKYYHSSASLTFHRGQAEAIKGERSPCPASASRCNQYLRLCTRTQKRSCDLQIQLSLRNLHRNVCSCEPKPGDGR
jgi:hypothetical protein